MNKAFKVAAGISAALVGTFAVLAKKAIDSADNFQKMSQRVGVSTETLSRMGFAAELGGTNLEAVEKGLGKLAKTVVDADDGMATYVRTFDKMGISLRDGNGDLKNTDVILLEVADKFATMEDGTLKTALSMDLFGKAGRDLIPTLNMGRDGLQEMFEQSDKLGRTIGTDTAESAARFTDALTMLSSGLQGIIFSILDAGLLDALVDLGEWMVSASESSTDFSQIGEVLTFVLESVQIAVLSLQLSFNLLVVGLMKGMQAINNIMGTWSPFKDLTEGLTASIEQYNEKLVTGAERIDKLWKGTGKLTKEVKKARPPVKRLTEEEKKLAAAAKTAAEEEKKLADELKSYVDRATAAITPTENVTQHYEWLDEAGLSLTEIMFTLGSEIDSAVEVFRELGEELPTELAQLVQLQVDADAASGALTRLISAENGLAQLSLKQPLEDYNQALKDITTEAGTTADGVKAKFEESEASITSSASVFTGTLESEFSGLLGGIDSNVVPGIDKIKVAFDSVMGTVNGFIDTFDTILGFFGKDGIGGIDLGGLFGGGGGGGFSFPGIGGGGGPPGGAGGGGSIVSGLNPLGGIISGIGSVIGGFLGGKHNKEVAFNTRLTLGWISDWFPEFQKVAIAGVGSTDRVANTLLNLETWAQFNGPKLANISTRMDELIPIQGNRIAPAVEGIRSRLDTTLNVNVSQPITVNVSGSGATAIASAVRSSVAAQNRKLIKDIKDNKGGIRKVIQDI